MILTHYAVLLKPGFAYAVARAIRADKHVDEGDDHAFYREGVEVFRVPDRYVKEVVGCESHKEATDKVREYREARAGAGAASAHISESGVAPRVHPRAGKRRASGHVAEGISVRVKE